MEKLSASVQNGVSYIISNENVGISPTVEVAAGSRVGDGFSSLTYAITIKGTEKTIHLFVKYLPEDKITRRLEMYQGMFKEEIRFYSEILPAMLTFQQKSKILDGFDNIPKYYSIKIKNVGTLPVILENLRCLGYIMGDIKQVIDTAHTNLLIKAFGKFHAISYAMKDQQPELFQNISSGIKDYLCEAQKSLRVVDYIGTCVEQFLQCLDPKEDKHILDKCTNLSKDLMELVSTVPDYADEYSVICHGDSWPKNMMFLYDEKSGIPIDVKLVDFQQQKYNSPVFDLSYVLFRAGTKESLENFDGYCDLYYNTLVKHMQELGSDPKKMFPREIFNQHWKKFAKFGLAMAFFTISGQFQCDEEIPYIMESSSAQLPEPESSTSPFDQDVFNEKMKMLVHHCIDRGFL